MKEGSKALFAIGCAVALACFAVGCTSPQASPAVQVVRVNASELASASSGTDAFSDVPSSSAASSAFASSSKGSSSAASSASADSNGKKRAKKLFKQLGITEDYREDFVHGDKPAKYQKYIVLHDTEGEGGPEDVVEYWDGNDARIAAHFVVGKDGHIVQCVPLDKIAHHAGFGDTGHNEQFGVEDESRDDKVGTTPIGDWAADYGMNSYSIGIEMVHMGGEGDYPEEQLEALDGLIAYIDAYYGKESEIVDHKAWRSGNSDTSEEFVVFLENYQDHRTHD